MSEDEGWIEFVWSHPGLQSKTMPSPPTELRLRVGGDVTLDELFDAFGTFAIAAGYSHESVKAYLDGDK